MEKSCLIPDEAYFTTLNHNQHLGVPGSYKGHPETTRISDRRKPYLARFKNRLKSKLHHWTCYGKWVREMCIFAIRDLPLLSTRKELFANKFHLDKEPLTFGCLEELIFNRTRDDYQKKQMFDASWYSTLGFVSDKVE
ncbi:N-acetyllactosaminide beta-1,6-N-acetylglucosaminyl-transferase-like [Mercenaria mercenaria]|uniref:N-acetyllactosaminide beta-1,6-N-acetylglucosaminyl-transferase-like n=1 Tax=Mercenaria mercenaria TaxID=6596 RepID=UPI00234F6FB0|nr:N-acetyllactosaminide beta-1,6-N-acetylglucosaminyl-transferase-like [Mercenaria mercenaria]